jgi:hypothetical protein
MRAFRREKIKELNLQATQMEFASEMIMKAARTGLKMTEVPCNLYPDGREGKSHLRTMRDGMRHLICMWTRVSSKMPDTEIECLTCGLE